MIPHALASSLTQSMTDLLSSPPCARLGLVLLHFLWQGALIAVAAEGAAILLRLRPGRPRYAAYLLGMILMAACPVATYMALPRPAVPDVALAPVARPGGASVEAPIATAPAPSRSLFPLEASASPLPAGWGESVGARVRAALPWATVAWAAGVALLAARLLAGMVGLPRLRKGAVPLPDLLRLRADALAERLGARRFRGAFASTRVAHPCAAGLWRQVVIVPTALLSGMPVDLFEAVLAHELAHIRRLDAWVNLGQRVMETLLFHHPAVWWLSARVRREREVCCDDLAAGATGREACAFALEHVARFSLGLPAARGEEFALAFGGRTDLLYRVRHLLGAPAARPRAGWPAGAVALVVLVAAVVASRSSSSAQSPPVPVGAGPDDRPAPTTAPVPVSPPAAESGAPDGLPTPQEEAKKEAREQAERDVRRAELSVQEAQVTLDAKDKALNRVNEGFKNHIVSSEDLDRAKVDVSLARIKLERSKLDLEDARVKLQAFTPSSVALSVELPAESGPGVYDRFGRGFYVRGREVTLKELLGQVRKTLDERFEPRGIGRVTVSREENGTRRKVVEAVPVQEVLGGKAGEAVLRAGDSVQVVYELSGAKDVSVTLNLPGPHRGAGSFGRLPRRDMTVTQAIQAYESLDPQTILKAKVTLERKEEVGYRKVLDAASMRDLLNGKVKDEVVQSNDRITVDE